MEEHTFSTLASTLIDGKDDGVDGEVRRSSWISFSELCNFTIFEGKNSYVALMLSHQKEFYLFPFSPIILIHITLKFMFAHEC